MRKLLYTAVSLALCSSVNAAPITSTQSVSTGAVLSGNVTDTSVTGTTPVMSTITRALTFGKFDTSTGVLVGVSSGLTFSAGSLTLSASGTRQGGGPQFGSTGSISAGSNLAGLTGFGLINDQLSNACDGTAACFPNGQSSNLSSTASLTKVDSTWMSPAVSAPSTSLNSYVGAGTMASTLTVTPGVRMTTENNITSEQAKLAVSGLSGSQSLTYSYLRHANASFASGADTNILSPASLTTGNPLAFSIFNLGDSSTTKLDFVSLQCQSGDCGAFSVSMPSFQDLIAGNSAAGSATLLANGVGNYSAKYLLTFSDDAAVGATASHLNNTLALNIEGSVAPVPEPGSWALTSLGLVGLAFLRRKR